MTCASSSVQTQEVTGPGGVTVVMKVSGTDDYSKNTHDCMAKFQLLMQAVSNGPVKTVDVMASDGPWGRKLGIRLDGFSGDGKRILGIYSEHGRSPETMLFDYDVASGKVTLVSLAKDVSRLNGIKCGTGFAVAGTTEMGAVVIEPDSTDKCQSNFHWVVTSAAGALKLLPKGKEITGLYHGE